MNSYLRKRVHRNDQGVRKRLPFQWSEVFRGKIAEDVLNLKNLEVSRFLSSVTAFVTAHRLLRFSNPFFHQVLVAGVDTSRNGTSSNNSSNHQIVNLSSNITESEGFELSTDGLYGIIIASGFVIMVLTFLIPCLRSLYLKKSAVYAVE